MTELTPEAQAVIDAALKYDDEHTIGINLDDERPDLADAVHAYRLSKLPAMPDRWARVYLRHTANPSWNHAREAAEAQMGGGHVAVVRYVAVPESVRWVS